MGNDCTDVPVDPDYYQDSVAEKICFIDPACVLADQDTLATLAALGLAAPLLAADGAVPVVLNYSSIAFDMHFTELTWAARTANSSCAACWYRMSLTMGFTDGRLFAQYSCSSVQYKHATIERYLDGMVRHMQGFANDPA